MNWNRISFINIIGMSFVFIFLLTVLLSASVPAYASDAFNWQSTSSMAEARGAAVTIATSQYIYVFGGHTPGDRGDIARAQIQLDGSLSAWQSAGAMSHSNAAMDLVQWGDYVYLVGGNLSGSRYDTIERYPINPDGSIGSYQMLNPMNVTRVSHGAVVYGDYMYAIGGYGNSIGWFDSTEYTNINPDGTVGTWNMSTTLPVKLNNFGIVAHNGYVYVIGGDSAIGARDSVYRSKIDAIDGSLGAWTLEEKSLTTPRRWAEAVQIGNFIYMIGGDNGSTQINSIEKATINPVDGSLSTWTILDPSEWMTSARDRFAITMNASHIYAVGGFNGSYLSTVEYSEMRSPISCELNTSSGIGGSVSDPVEGTNSYSCGTVLPIVAEADTCYEFTGWTGSGVDMGKVVNPNIASTSITLDSDYYVTANFEPTKQVSLPIDTTGSCYFGCLVDATVNCTSLTTPGLITITVHPNEYFPGTNGDTVKRWYEIDSTAVGVFDLTLSYDDSELGTEIESNLCLWRNSGVWDGAYEGSVDTVSNTVTVTDIIVFSDWVIADNQDGNPPVPEAYTIVLLSIGALCLCGYFWYRNQLVVSAITN